MVQSSKERYQSCTIPKLVCLLLINNFYHSHSMFLLITRNVRCFVAIEFTERQLILTRFYNIKCEKCYWKCQQSLWKLSVKELFPNKVTVSRPATNNLFLQKNFPDIKFKLSYLTSWEKNFWILSKGCAWTLSLNEAKAKLNGLRY